MALRQGKQVVDGYPVPSSLDAVAGICDVSEFIVPSGLAVNDVVEMGAIPEGHIVVDCTLVCEDLDGGTGIVLNAGLLSGVYASNDQSRTCGSEFLSGSTIGQTGGVARANVGAGLLLTPNLDVVGYGFKVATAAGTPVVGAKVRMYVWLKSAPVGI